MVKFCKNGSDATSGAVRLARAYTGREYHRPLRRSSFLSVDDWFIGTTQMNAGIPEAMSDLSSHSRMETCLPPKPFSAYRDQVAGIILEAARNCDPPPGYLSALKALCHRHGALSSSMR